MFLSIRADFGSCFCFDRLRDVAGTPEGSCASTGASESSACKTVRVAPLADRIRNTAMAEIIILIGAVILAFLFWSIIFID